MKTTSKIVSVCRNPQSPVRAVLSVTLALLLNSSPCLAGSVATGTSTSSKTIEPAARQETTEEINMNDKHYTTTFTVDQSPAEVFNAINNVRGWWSQAIEGDTTKAGAVFTYRFKDIHHCQLKIIEIVPNQKVVWEVLENRFSFTKDATEWTGTKICFEVAEKNGKTQVRFTHIGLVPQYECYHACSDGWKTYLNGSLRNLITTGKGQPNVGDAITQSERKLD
jgi:uncharacterized protein YndB with AHSA1/START domain